MKESAQPVPRGLARFKPYPAYKHSGVEWLGEIPAHWEVKPLKHMANFINGFGFKPDEWGLDGTPIIRIENLNGGENFNYTTRELPGKYCAERGDLLFGWSGNRGTSFGPFVWWRSGKHYVNQHIFHVVGFDVDKAWLYWALRGVTFYVEKQAHGIIGMVHITRGELGSIPIPVLPRHEQERFARFLDRETARIDALAAKKERLIELLQEKRTALITRAVTKGLDPHVPMKDSGVEWLGEIPAHWEVKKWRYSCHVTAGQVAPDDDRYRDRVMIAPNHIESGTGRILSTETADEQGAISGKYLVSPGDIIYSKIRPALNKACIATEDWLCSADMYPVKITANNLSSNFLLYFILSEPFVRLMVDESMRVAMPKVNRDKLAACPLPIPPQAEQEAIATLLDRETARIDALVTKIRDAIERLKELRTALISAAVTGKIDVREEAA